jgi:hypothetical protein
MAVLQKGWLESGLHSQVGMQLRFWEKRHESYDMRLIEMLMFAQWRGSEGDGAP